MRVLAAIALLCAVASADPKMSRNLLEETLRSGDAAAVLGKLKEGLGASVLNVQYFVRDVCMCANDSYVALQRSPRGDLENLAAALVDLADKARARWARSAITAWAVQEAAVFRQRTRLPAGEEGAKALYDAARDLPNAARDGRDMEAAHLRSIHLHFDLAHVEGGNSSMAAGNVVNLQAFLKSRNAGGEALEIAESTTDWISAWTDLRAGEKKVEEIRKLVRAALDRLKGRLAADGKPFYAVRRYNDLVTFALRHGELGIEERHFLVPLADSSDRIKFGVPLSHEWRILKSADKTTVWQQGLDGRPLRSFVVETYPWHEQSTIEGTRKPVSGKDLKGLLRGHLKRDRKRVKSKLKYRGPVKGGFCEAIPATLSYWVSGLDSIKRYGKTTAHYFEGNGRTHCVRVTEFAEPGEAVDPVLTVFLASFKR